MQVPARAWQQRLWQRGANRPGSQAGTGHPAPGPQSSTEGRASASKAARLEPCRCVALMRSSADSSADTSAHASVGRSSGGGGPSSGGRKSALRCSAASVRSAWRTHAFQCISLLHQSMRTRRSGGPAAAAGRPPAAESPPCAAPPPACAPPDAHTHFICLLLCILCA